MAQRLSLKLTDNLFKKKKPDTAAPKSQGVNAKRIQRAIDNPSPETLTPDVVNALQASHGNHFVSNLVQSMGGAPTVGAGLSAPIQAKLTVTAANDQHEQEADAVAKNVVNQIQGGDVQREEALEEEGSLQAQRIQRFAPGEEEMPSNASPASAPSNASPASGTSNTAPEEEMAAKRIQREGDDDEIPTAASGASGTSAANDDDQYALAAKRMQRDAAGGDYDFYEGGDVGNDIEGQIESARGGGQAMDDNTRSNMESAFGADFSNVRVHTDAQSSELNNSVQAKAFTTGQDIFFNKGQYDPKSSSGQELLAHELTHVVQQNGPAVQKKEEK